MSKSIVPLLLILLAGLVFLSGCIGQEPGTTTTLPQTGHGGGLPGGGVGANVGTQTIITKLSSSAAVEMKDMAFDPSVIHLKVGGTVTWDNVDSVNHKVVSDDGTEFSSAELANGQAFSHTFSTAGTYAYHCSIHPSMTGTIVVGS
jgi:plastocyanin